MADNEGQIMKHNRSRRSGKIFDEKLLFVHNVKINDNIRDMNPAKWTYLLYKGRSQMCRPVVNNVQYKAFGSSNESVICIELYGEPLQQELIASQEISDAACLLMLRNIDPSINVPTLSGVSDDQWKALTNIVNKHSVTSEIQKIVNSCMLSVIYSICRTGILCRPKKQRLLLEFRRNNDIDVSMPDEVIEEYWLFVASNYDYLQIQQVMVALLSLFQERSNSFHDLIKAARRRSLNRYYAVLEALTRFYDFFSDSVFVELVTEMDAFQKARALVRDRPYYGYGPIGIATAINYPNLAYIGIKLCRGKFIQGIWPKLDTEKWDKLIDIYLKKDRPEVPENHLVLVKMYLQNMRYQFGDCKEEIEMKSYNNDNSYCERSCANGASTIHSSFIKNEDGGKERDSDAIGACAMHSSFIKNEDGEKERPSDAIEACAMNYYSLNENDFDRVEIAEPIDRMQPVPLLLSVDNAQIPVTTHQFRKRNLSETYRSEERDRYPLKMAKH